MWVPHLPSQNGGAGSGLRRLYQDLKWPIALGSVQCGPVRLARVTYLFSQVESTLHRSVGPRSLQELKSSLKPLCQPCSLRYKHPPRGAPLTKSSAHRDYLFSKLHKGFLGASSTHT